MAIVLGLVLVLLVLFFREILPIPVTALLAAIVLMGTGILDIKDGLSGFSSPATIAVMSMFVLSAGIQQTGAVNILTEKLSLWSGKSRFKQVGAISLAAGPLSGFINNTPVVAVMIPAVSQMARTAGLSPSKLLMPLSHVAMLGGLLTIIGTSTNLLGNSVLTRLGIEPFGFFEFSIVGLIALGTGVVYHLLIGGLLLPDRGSGDLVERFDMKGFLAEYVIPGESELTGKNLREAGLTFQQGVHVVRITRDGQTVDAPHAFTRIFDGDELVLEGSRKRLAELQEKGLQALPELRHPLADEDVLLGGIATAEVVITTGSRYVGHTVKAIDFRRRYDAQVLAVRHHGRVEIGPISESRLSPGDVLLVQATPRALDRMREKPDLYVTREREKESYRPEKMPHALLIVLGVVLVAALGWMDIAVAALTGAALMVILGVLRIEEFLGNIQWDIVLMLAGIIPLGVALEKTGAAALLADAVVGLGAYMPGWWFLVFLFLATSLITEMVSNNASVVLLIPVATAAAISLGMDPRPVGLTVMLAASTSMLTPIGYQTNTMIYAPGNYQFRDYLRVGGPLNLILAFVIPAAIAWQFPL